MTLTQRFHQFGASVLPGIGIAETEETHWVIQHT